MSVKSGAKVMNTNSQFFIKTEEKTITFYKNNLFFMFFAIFERIYNRKIIKISNFAENNHTKISI